MHAEFPDNKRNRFPAGLPVPSSTNNIYWSLLIPPTYFLQVIIEDHMPGNYLHFLGYYLEVTMRFKNSV